ncbi:MAG TPA: class I SAM-dependent methyltransferase [Acidobacteria bacterium]|nr:class I SAM-dependent methyltransferase [Acidobacteriota bacterium]
MSDDPHRPDDPYSRVNYRRLIAWEQRIAREGPFLLSLLDRAPERSVVDIGCGTGEHVAFFAAAGARAVGLDRSAGQTWLPVRIVLRRFDARAVLGDEPPFGLAICLGNMLPHMGKDADLSRFFEAVRDILRPGGLLLIQLLNYEGFLTTGQRALPVNVRPGDDGREIVFLRLMSPADDGRVLFFPATLELDPEADTPLTVTMSRRVELRAWTRADLAPALAAAGFEVAFHGDMIGGAFVLEDSSDLVVVATRT